jgi:hypothetical protein
LIDFSILYDHPISSPCVLWEHCSSHCCHIGSQVRTFDAETDLVILPIPEVEFEYLHRVGSPDEQWLDAKRSFDVEISGYSLKVYMQPCNLGGRCDSGLRPMICRIYPYIPLIDDDFRIAGTINATAFDLVWTPGTSEDPCLMRSAPETARHLGLLNDLVSKLKIREENLEILLWFNLAFRYLEAFKLYLEQSFPEGGDVPLKDRFHNLYLCNKTQLFLAAPEFRSRLDGEVERYRRWRSHGVT